MYARRLTLQDNSYAHVFFRCHNREMFFQTEEVKSLLVFLWAKYAKKFGVAILDFIVMDNHAHLAVKASSVRLLGDFMRTVNSQIARYINKLYKRDSQAIRERYKSPIVSTIHYLEQLVQYIWMNRRKVDEQSDPRLDRFCSLAWRLNPAIVNTFTEDDEQRALLRALLTDDPAIYPKERGQVQRFLNDHFNAAHSKLAQLTSAIFTHGHTIGDEISVSFRSELLNAYRKTAPPPRYDLND